MCNQVRVGDLIFFFFLATTFPLSHSNKKNNLISLLDVREVLERKIDGRATRVSLMLNLGKTPYEPMTLGDGLTDVNS